MTFDALFAQELDYILASLRRLGVPERDVEDVAQDVFVRVHGKMPPPDPERPRPWLFAFARRAAANYRKLARHRAMEAREEPAALRAPGTPEDEAADRQRVALVHAVLAEMPEKLRVVMIMADLDGCTADEIAQELEVPLGTVYSRVRKAREVFRSVSRRKR